MNKSAVNVTLYTASLVVLCSLLYSAHMLNTRSSELKKFIRLLYVITAGNSCCLLFTFLYGNPGVLVHWGMMLLSLLAYIFLAYGSALFVSYLYRAKKSDYVSGNFKSVLLRGVFILSALQIVHIMLNPVTGSMFVITAGNRMKAGPYFGLNEIMVMAQMIFMMILVGIHPNIRLKKQPLWLICFLPFAACGAMLADHRSGYIYPFYALSLLLVYVNVHLQDEHMLRQSEIELHENRLSLLMGQIQPHFVFNVLNTIYYLCDSDSEKAMNAARNFRLFLENAEMNRDYRGTVPFEKELEYVRHYTDLEKLRFDQIDIIYDIRVSDFSIPPLTVQPLVENAIRHGLREMAGGTVVIRAYRNIKEFVIEVRDNGIGFNPEKAKDGRSHVGIENVRNRISIISGAQLTIEPVYPHGTCASITIPIH